MTNPNATVTTGYWFYQLQGADEFDAMSSPSNSPPQGMLSAGSELRDQDVVFLWLSGSDPGLKGWGIASIGPAVSASNAPASGLRLPLMSFKLSLGLAAPIPRTALASYPGLSDAPLIRQNQTGAYFRLSAEQAFGLCDLLRSRGFAAPEIAVDQVLEPIARRVERELVGLQKLLPEVVSPDVAKRLSAQSAATNESLSSGGVLRAHEEIKALIDALGSVVVPATGAKSSSLAPLDAARTRLMNDVSQIARFADPAVRVPVEAAARGALDLEVVPAPSAPLSADQPAPGPSPIPATQPTLAAAPPRAATLGAAATQPPVVPAASTPLLEPNDPLFRHWEQTDLIGIGAAVNNLGRYIAHEGLVPPAAIGVFGDWGSGKTFFIRALQSQIALLSSQSRDALRDGRTTVFCSHIVQIEFNAWHFVESNLWASLAAHIFDRLYAELERRGKTEGSSGNIDGLYQQFSAYKQAVAEKARLNKLVETLAKQRDVANAKKLEAEKSVMKRLSALATVLREQLGTLTTEQLTKWERARLDELLRVSNLEELGAAQAQAAAVVKEGRTFLGRMRVQFTWWGGWQLAIFVVLIVAAVFGLPTLVSWLLYTQAGYLERIAALVGGYAAVAIGALGWLASAGRKLIAGAQKIERVLVDVRTKVESTPDSKLEEARRNLAAAESDLTLIERQIADQHDRLAELADELDPNQLGTRLQTFLEARVKGDTYQKHLGLISLVRKDFSSLYELMQKYWQQRKQPVPEILAEVRNALGEVTNQQVPFIERIVLYIDDLDRCPEDKVVEVLQAVHLMLGLPLFVVVVAVDVRWVGQSIRKHYGKLVGWDEEGSSSATVLPSASADDYLEKIFQIPYRIHPMEPEVRKLLLGGLLRQPYLSGGSASAALQTPVVIQQELVPKELSLYPQELQSIQELYQSVGSSPRRVRRFLDVYRLMRAGMEEGDVQDLISQRHYAVILALFAFLSGAPETAPRIIELLRKETLRLDDDPVAGTFAKQSMVDWSMSALSQNTMPADESEVMYYAMAYLDGLSFSRPDLLAVLRRWIPEIARYSFREVRMGRI